MKLIKGNGFCKETNTLDTYRQDNNPLLPPLHRLTNDVPSIQAIEFVIMEIWQRVLTLENIGRDDDFFALGGDSGALLQIATELSDRGFWLEPGQLTPLVSGEVLVDQNFHVPTIAQLASIIVRNHIEISEAEQADDILAHLEELTPEQIDAILDRHSHIGEQAHEG